MALTGIALADRVKLRCLAALDEAAQWRYVVREGRLWLVHLSRVRIGDVFSYKGRWYCWTNGERLIRISDDMVEAALARS